MPILLPSGLEFSQSGPGTPGVTLHDGQVVIGNLTLGQVDEYGVEWIVEDVIGWRTPPGSTGSVEQRVGAHGGYPTEAHYTSRTIEVVGSLIAKDYASASMALDRLWSAIPLDEPTLMYVAEGGGRTLVVEVRQEQQPLTPDSGEGWVRFSISLSAPDPRRYDAAITTASTGLPTVSGGLTFPKTFPYTIGATVVGGTVSLFNAGNMSSPWVATYQGPPATITHRGTGRSLHIQDEVTAGRVLALDSSDYTAVLDGTASRVVGGMWFDLEPGLNEIALTSAFAGPAALSVSFRSAWR